MISLQSLLAPLDDGDLVLARLAEHHREGLRAACAADADIWQIYSSNMAGAAFDPAFDAIIANPLRYPFALIVDGAIIGMSGYLNVMADRQTLEIGGTYMEPKTRRTGLNALVKHLLVTRAFDCGFRRIEFRIDARNLRSQRAAEKIGAVREGLLRAERVTWTGHVRDTALFSILADEWPKG